MPLVTYLGWVRIGFASWKQVAGVFDKHEGECWSKLKKWVETNRKKPRYDLEKVDMHGDGELVVLLAGVPPVLPGPLPPRADKAT